MFLQDDLAEFLKKLSSFCMIMFSQSSVNFRDFAEISVHSALIVRQHLLKEWFQILHGANLVQKIVDLENASKRIFGCKSAMIQPRTSFPKFGKGRRRSAAGNEAGIGVAPHRSQRLHCARGGPAGKGLRRLGVKWNPSLERCWPPSRW